VRPLEKSYPETEQKWINWLNKRKKLHPVTVIMNNQVDIPWPHYQNSFTLKVLSHPSVKYLCVTNPFIIHEKVIPIPIGLKYQEYRTKMYAEDKREKNALYESVSKSPAATKQLFLDKQHDRTLTVWVRPMRGSDDYRIYNETNEALKTRRSDICRILNKTAPNSVNCHEHDEKMNQTLYFSSLKKHTFVASPPGRGLDSHSTWEALLAGCIPIVPHSTLDPMFKYLPVWLIDSWEEITDNEVKRKRDYFHKNIWNWDKIFIDGWIKDNIRAEKRKDIIWDELYNQYI